MAQLEQLQNPLSAEGIKALSQAAGDTPFLAQSRSAAFARFEALPLPSRTEEAWRRTDISGLSFAGLIPYAAPSAELPARIAGLAGGNALVQHNSAVVARRLDDFVAAQGVIFTDLVTAAREFPQLVEPVLGKGTPEDKFTALNAATVTGGTFVYVPSFVEVTVPLQTVVFADRADLALATQTVIVAEPGARVTFIETFAGKPGLHTHVAAIHAKDGSQVRYTCLQDFEEENTKSFVIRSAFTGNDASVDFNLAEFGGSLVRAENTTYLDGNGSSNKAIVLLFGDGKQHIDIGQVALHKGDHTTSGINHRSVLAGSCRVIYRANGHILDGSKSSSAYQKSNSLILSDEARADAIPALMIDETDVAGAGHAATAGQIDKEQLFYLQSRGIPEKKATRMIVEGFLAPILAEIPAEAVRNEIIRLVDRKMSHA